MSLSWMAWTWQTASFFIFIGGAITIMIVWEVLSPGGNPRFGILRLNTTRGDRLFISLLASAFIHLGWLAVFCVPIYGATIVSVVLTIVIFRWV